MTLESEQGGGRAVAPPPGRVAIVYRLSCPPAEVERLSRDIAYEQTVEVPPALITSRDILENIVGSIDEIVADPARPDSFQVTISYREELTAYHLPQLLNLIYGNISIKPWIRLEELRLPEAVLARFRGPAHGVPGLRQMLGVYGRPLLATALKPLGSSVAELAQLAGDFALGGGDVVKDDHNLHDRDFAGWKQRVTACQKAVNAANERTGRRTLYAPNLTAPCDQLERYAEYLVSAGIRGVLIAPFLLGLDTVRHLADKFGLFVMAHPTLGGTFFHDPRHGVEPGVLLGTLFRLMGADASIFPNYGGRFAFSAADCAGIGRALRTPLGNLRPAWPTPAGGMRFDNLPQMADQYGADSLFLIGGGLLSHSGNLTDSTRAFVERIEEQFPAGRTSPQPAAADEFVSACELPGNAQAAVRRLLSFQEDFTWDGRTPLVYKASAELPFRDVARHELLGQQGEQTAFDLRYFQIAPGGYSSREKHGHTHAVICIRGTGTLECDGEELVLNPLDVAYVPPMMVHQLKNRTTEPFGFFCIVDHERDRPQRP